jgi:hypothetical protein
MTKWQTVPIHKKPTRQGDQAATRQILKWSVLQ